MSYCSDQYDLGDCIEYEFKFKGEYGTKGEKRGERRKATPEEIQRNNQRTKEKKLRRTIHLNFHEDDLWMTLKYPKGSRVTIGKVKKDVCGKWSGFLATMRRKYRLRGVPFKFIYRIEIGHMGGVHIHIIMNRIEGVDTALLAKKTWADISGGSANFEHLYSAGGFEGLAKYIAKPAESDDGQLTMFGVEGKKAFTKISSSRNLIRPEDVRTEKKYSHWTMRRLILEGPKPHPGYYIDRDSIVTGINPFTGYSYFYYTERKLKKERRKRGNTKAYQYLCPFGRAGRS